MARRVFKKANRCRFWTLMDFSIEDLHISSENFRDVSRMSYYSSEGLRRRQFVYVTDRDCLFVEDSRVRLVDRTIDVLLKDDVVEKQDYPAVMIGKGEAGIDLALTLKKYQALIPRSWRKELWGMYLYFPAALHIYRQSMSGVGRGFLGRPYEYTSHYDAKSYVFLKIGKDGDCSIGQHLKSVTRS